MAPLREFIAKHNCEEVGGRLIAVVDGKKEYVAEILDGGYTLTYHGHKLEAQTAAPEPAVEEKPKRRKKDADASSNDLLAGIEV